MGSWPEVVVQIISARHRCANLSMALHRKSRVGGHFIGESLGSWPTAAPYGYRPTASTRRQAHRLFAIAQNRQVSGIVPRQMARRQGAADADGGE
jgi:hypothetical protein